MPNISEMMASRFLRKEDVQEDITLKIAGVSQEEMPGDDGEMRWVLKFDGVEKGLVMNQTIMKVLGKAFGGNTEDWFGERVTLYIDEGVMFKGQMVGGIRVRPVKKGKANAAAKPEASKDPGAPFDDEIPM